MNMQLREADWGIDTVEAVHPPRARRRRVLLLQILGVLIVLAASTGFWIWYTTLCGSCAPPIPCAKRCVKPIMPDRIDALRPKTVDRVNPDPAPQNR